MIFWSERQVILGAKGSRKLADIEIVTLDVLGTTQLQDIVDKTDKQFKRHPITAWERGRPSIKNQRRRKCSENWFISIDYVILIFDRETLQFLLSRKEDLMDLQQGFITMHGMG